MKLAPVSLQRGSYPLVVVYGHVGMSAVDDAFEIEKIL